MAAVSLPINETLMHAHPMPESIVRPSLPVSRDYFIVDEVLGSSASRQW